MTGYGRGETDHAGTKFSVELNSVNRKQSDVVINVPRDLVELEPRIRQTINESISRGRTNATVTLHTAPLADVCGMAADQIPLTTTRVPNPGRLVLVDGTELDWQRARYREGRHLFAPVDPVLVGLNTLQHWLWSRIGSPAATDHALAVA